MKIKDEEVQNNDKDQNDDHCIDYFMIKDLERKRKRA